MSSRMSLVSFRGSCTVAMAMLLAMPVNAVLGAQAAPGGADFDIPISELNKVKKKAPAKRSGGETKKKKKSAAKKAESSQAAASPSESAEGNKPAVKAENLPIHHTPYSFVVAGKRTVINAVINSRDEIKEVNCSVSAAEGGTPTVVKMEKVSGTLFTYSATLPPAPQGAAALRYTIVSVDAQGAATRSQEFAIPVTASPVVPSWQAESAVEAPATGSEGDKKPQSAAPAAPAASAVPAVPAASAGATVPVVPR